MLINNTLVCFACFFLKKVAISYHTDSPLWKQKNNLIKVNLKTALQDEVL